MNQDQLKQEDPAVIDSAADDDMRELALDEVEVITGAGLRHMQK
jgi:hypothetical protein